MLHAGVRKWLQIRDPFQYLVHFNFQVHHVLHIGAHLGEEYDKYVTENVGQTSWVEPNPALYEQLCARVLGAKVLSAAVTDKDGELVTLRIAENSVSSSIFEINSDSAYSYIHSVGEVQVRTMTLGRVLAWANDSASYPVDFLVLDVQGAEGLILRGDVTGLDRVHAISVEVSVKTVYSGSPSYGEVKMRLESLGFYRAGRFINNHSGHGDELWLNRKLGLRFRIKYSTLSLCRALLERFVRFYSTLFF